MVEEKIKKFEENMPESGIEPDNENEVLDDPFNPEEISITSKTVSMDMCLRRIEQGTILLNPDFQRKEVWTLEKKSQLIESLMLNIPLPMFYVSADEKNNYTVVDGLQRLSTIRSYILGDDYLAKKVGARKGDGFTLKGLEFWKDFDGKTFNQLPINIRNNILESEFTFTIINPGTPEEVRRNIFKRLNTGGEPLSSQEIRNALYLGKSTILLNELSEYKSFKEATSYSIKDLRMADKELILRFISFLIRDYSSYRRTVSVDTHLSDTMIIINAMPELNTRDYRKLLNMAKDRLRAEDIVIKEIDTIKILFEKAMNRAKALFGQHTFRKSYGNNRRSPINKSLFETWGVLLSALTKREFVQLLNNKKALMQDYRPFLSKDDFRIAISRDSMKHASVKYRFETIEELIKKHSV